jgi:hypothetical protein
MWTPIDQLHVFQICVQIQRNDQQKNLNQRWWGVEDDAKAVTCAECSKPQHIGESKESRYRLCLMH